MRVRKFKRFELCYVNRLLDEQSLYFDNIFDILEFVDCFHFNILYIKYCYDFKRHYFIYNFLSVIRKD